MANVYTNRWTDLGNEWGVDEENNGWRTWASSKWKTGTASFPKKLKSPPKLRVDEKSRWVGQLWNEKPELQAPPENRIPSQAGSQREISSTGPTPKWKAGAASSPENQIPSRAYICERKNYVTAQLIGNVMGSRIGNIHSREYIAEE